MFCVYGLFKTTLALELGIERLKDSGFSTAVVVLKQHGSGKQTLLDSMYGGDGMSLVDGVSIAASIGMLLGVIYGSLVAIGPVALGLIGAVAGGAVGYLLDRKVNKRNLEQREIASGDVIVVVACKHEEEVSQVEKIMKEHRTVAVGRHSYR